MVGPVDIVIVSLIAIGSVVVVGILGYLIEKMGAPEGKEDQ
jgi:hypothetical protein